MLRPDAETDFLAFSLPDALTSSLSGLESLVVRSSMAASRFGGDAIGSTKDRGRGRRRRDRHGHAAACRRRSPRQPASSPMRRPARCSGPTRRRRRSAICFSVQDELDAAHRRLAVAAADASRAADAAARRAVEREGLRDSSCAAISSATTRSSGASRAICTAMRRGGSALRAGVGAPGPDPSRDGEVSRDRNARGAGSRGGGVPAGARAQSGSADRAQAVRAARSGSRPRARCDGAPRRARAKRRPGAAGRAGQHVPLLRLARGIGRRSRARASSRAEDPHERAAHVVPASATTRASRGHTAPRSTPTSWRSRWRARAHGGGMLWPAGAGEDHARRGCAISWWPRGRCSKETRREHRRGRIGSSASDFRDPEGLFYLVATPRTSAAGETRARPFRTRRRRAASSVFRRWPATPGSTRSARNRRSRNCFARPRASIARLQRRSRNLRVKRSWASRAFLERDFGTGTGIRTPVPWLRNAAGDLDGFRLRRFCSGFRTDFRVVFGRRQPVSCAKFQESFKWSASVGAQPLDRQNIRMVMTRGARLALTRASQSAASRNRPSIISSPARYSVTSSPVSCGSSSNSLRT